MKRTCSSTMRVRTAGILQWRLVARAVLCLLLVPASLQAAPLFATPLVIPAPLVIPTPKHLRLSGSVFRIGSQTRLVVADDATAADKAAALSVRQALHEQFGLPLLPIVRERRVHGDGHNLLLFGETRRVRRLAKALTQRGASVPLHSEGYCLRVGADQVIVAGRDVRGALPYPGRLPYDPAAVFTRLYDGR